MHPTRTLVYTLLLASLLTGAAPAAPSQGIEGTVHRPRPCYGTKAMGDGTPTPCGPVSLVSGSPRVWVHIYDARGQEVATPLTDALGYFSAPLPAGVYTVRLADYEPDTGIQVVAGQVARADLFTIPRRLP